jgi:hypothetical protein
MEAGGHRQDQTAALAHRERPDVTGRRPVLVAPARRVEAIDLAPLDVGRMTPFGLS